MKISREEALDYHSSGRKGKIEVNATKPFLTSRDLSLAYTPGVAEPCREISKNTKDVYKYTAKGNLVAVISNGTAVLGLGNIGPEAGKPVMEGKGVLFKRFADIDVFDIEINTEDPKEVIKTVQLLEPTFGGINLEDIKAPECFEIEETLKETMNLPVFHDDQHGTAIISCAALINAAELAGKKLEDVRVIVNGAGAAAISCSNLYMKAGVKRENIFMFDSKGCITKDRKDLNKYKKQFAQKKGIPSLEEAFVDADVFIGLSIGGVVSKKMVAAMAPNPILFAMANPDPEIMYDDAISVRDDLIMATGRSDFPNQVNNVLGFPFIFRGALDVRATTINEEMKIAAIKALSGVATVTEMNWDEYEERLKERLGFSKEIIRVMIHKAQKNPRNVVYPEGEEETIIRAAHVAYQDNIAYPILLGNRKVIQEEIKRLAYDESEFKIIDPEISEERTVYARAFFKKRERKGATYKDARALMKKPNYYAAMMVEVGNADAMIGGLTSAYPNTIRPALECIGIKENFNIVSGLYIVVAKQDVYYFADTTVNVNPTAEQLAEIAISAADTVKEFDVTPKIAMLSFSNFGSAPHSESRKVKEATRIVKERRPDLMVDGEMQADTAVNPEIIEKEFPFCELKGRANVLVFPDLNAGNIAYKLMDKIGQATLIGPVLMGMKKPIHVLQRGATVDDIINMTAIAVVEAS
jgi:malate dehydrogenase (oxaloacetate-decarboxylating)(NADP+)